MIFTQPLPNSGLAHSRAEVDRCLFDEHPEYAHRAAHGHEMAEKRDRDDPGAVESGGSGSAGHQHGQSNTSPELSRRRRLARDPTPTPHPMAKRERELAAAVLGKERVRDPAAPTARVPATGLSSSIAETFATERKWESRNDLILVSVEGFEPSTGGLRVRCSAS